MSAVDHGSGGRASRNRHRAILLVASSAALVGFVAALLAWLVLAPLVALAVGVIVAAALACLAWWGSESLALRLLGAQPADPVTHARLFNLVEGLGANAGVPQPDLYVVTDAGLNILTMGRSPHHAALVVTSGLLDQLSRIELEAVLAHEVSHIRNDDILTATVAVGLFGILGRPARRHGNRRRGRPGVAPRAVFRPGGAGPAALDRPSPGGDGRQFRRPSDPLSARLGVRPGEDATARHTGEHRFRCARDRPPVAGRAPSAAAVSPIGLADASLRHPSAPRRAH